MQGKLPAAEALAWTRSRPGLGTALVGLGYLAAGFSAGFFMLQGIDLSNTKVNNVTALVALTGLHHTPVLLLHSALPDSTMLFAVMSPFPRAAVATYARR